MDKEYFQKVNSRSFYCLLFAMYEEATQLKRKVQRFSSALLPNIAACAQSNISTYSCICFCTCTFQLGRKQGHTNSCQFSRSPKLNKGQTSATTAIVRRLKRGYRKQNQQISTAALAENKVYSLVKLTASFCYYIKTNTSNIGKKRSIYHFQTLCQLPINHLGIRQKNQLTLFRLPFTSVL